MVFKLTYGNITVLLDEQHGKTNPTHDGSDSLHRDLRLRAYNIMQKPHYKYLMADQAGPFLLIHYHNFFYKKKQVTSFSFIEINFSDLK